MSFYVFIIVNWIIDLTPHNIIVVSDLNGSDTDLI